MKSNLFEWGGCGLSAVLTVTQTNEVFQLISLILTCLSTLVVLLFTIWKWYIKAKEDGKITVEEINEGIDIIKDGVEELQNNVKENKE